MSNRCTAVDPPVLAIRRGKRMIPVGEGRRETEKNTARPHSRTKSSSQSPSSSDSEIEKRKNEHIFICLNEDVGFCKTNGFERYAFTHNALPELSLSEIDTSTTFLEKSFSLPFFIEALTGGSPTAAEINQNLARAAAELGIGMGVGSQRAMLEFPQLTESYQVRDVAPSILLFGNIGATQLVGMDMETIVEMVNAIKADGLAVHLNAAQEICQPGGDTDWRDVRYHIQRVCSQAPFPIIVKETGCGINATTALALASAGVACIDVAGAGGTSFAKVEAYRVNQPSPDFGEWGIPTAESLRQCRQAVDLPLIASGGMRTGIQCAKALAMGASLVGLGLPLLEAAQRSHSHVVAYLTTVGNELKRTMLLVGARDIAALKQIALLQLSAYSI